MNLKFFFFFRGLLACHPSPTTAQHRMRVSIFAYDSQPDGFLVPAAAQILSAPINLGGSSSSRLLSTWLTRSRRIWEISRYESPPHFQLTPCWSHFLPCSIISENNQKVLSMECNHRTPCIISIHTSYSLFLYTSLLLIYIRGKNFVPFLLFSIYIYIYSIWYTLVVTELILIDD